MPRLPRVQPGRAKTIERSSAGRRLRPIAVAALVLVDILGLLAMYRSACNRDAELFASKSAM